MNAIPFVLMWDLTPPPPPFTIKRGDGWIGGVRSGFCNPVHYTLNCNSCSGSGRLKLTLLLYRVLYKG
jgi:hypothetical protein